MKRLSDSCTYLMGCQTAFYKSRNRRSRNCSRSRGRGRGRFQFDPLNLLMKNEIFLYFSLLNIPRRGAVTSGQIGGYDYISADIMRACKQIIPSLLSSAVRLTS
uniref:Uncharacterized protein n=1 Tax=Glossina austeni TaxID=7395 RepID=A0A1A9UZI2_GLOAU